MRFKRKTVKGFFALLICFSLLLTSAFSAFAESDVVSSESHNTEKLLGDVNTDGKITAADASVVLEWVLGRAELPVEQIELARVTGSKVVEIKDAVAILEKVLDNSFSFIPYEGDDEEDTTKDTESTMTTETTTEDDVTETEETTEDDVTETEETTEDDITETEETTENNVTEPEETTEDTTEFKPYLLGEIKADDFALETITSNKEAGFFTINAQSDKSVAISEKSAVYDNESFVNRINLSGTGSTEYRNISFEVNQNVLIRVIGNATSQRALILNDGEKTLSQNLNASVNLVTYNYETNSEKTLYLYSGSGGINIYKVEVWATGDSGGDIVTPPEETTESTTESTEDGSENTTDAEKAPDYYFSLDDDAEAGEISQNMTLGNIGVLADSENKVIITETDEIYDGTAYKKAVALTSNGSTQAGALSFDALSPSVIRITAKGGGTLVLADENGVVSEQSVMSDGVSYYAFNYDGGNGTLYIYAQDLNSDILIYSVEVFKSYSKFSISGFGADKITGGGSVSESDSEHYAKVSDAEEFDTLIYNIQKGKSNVRVIEITEDLNLGIYEIEKAHPNYTFQVIKDQGNQAATSQTLKETGVSKVNFDLIQNLTIYSKNGAKIKHGCFNFSSVNNIIIRNLEFDELWEWDEGEIASDGTVESEPGNYDRNDWDYMTFKIKTGEVNGSSNVWVDHCTFNKAYDGILDVKNGSNNIIVSWCRIQGDDMSEGSWVRTQIEELEKVYQNDLKNGTVTYPLYYHLRKNDGYSTEDIIRVEAPQKKAHLIGASNSEANMDKLSITIANCYYKEIQDRIPRLRGGNAHIFNTVIDSSEVYRTSKEVNPGTTMAKSHFGITNQALLSTCGGALLAENLYITDVGTPMRFEQDKGYAGKLLAENIKYQLHNTSDFTKWKYDYEGVSSTDGLEGFKPYSAYSSIAAFSWNESGSPDYIKNGELAYDYTLIEPDKLSDRVVPFTGAGAMKNWNGEWLITQYN